MSFSTDELANVLTYLMRSSDWLLPAAAGLLSIGLVARVVRWILEPAKNTSFPNDEKDEHALRAALAKMNRELEGLRSVLMMTGTLNASLNYERVLDLTLDLGEAALGDVMAQGDKHVSALLLFEEDNLRIAYARGFTHADKRVRLPGEEGVLGQTLANPRSSITDAAHEDPELKQLTGLHGCRSVVCLPILVGLEVYGVLLFGHTQLGFFDLERVELLEAIAQQAVVALQNALLYSDLAEEKERIQVIQEEARKKLARDLHDGPTQSVGAITMRLSYARTLVDRDTVAAREELFKIEELARRTTKEIRQMLFALRPLILESEGLVPALEYLAYQAKETYGQKITIKAAPDAARNMEIGKQNVLFHVVEEAISNARKHAKAKNVWVRAKNEGDLFILEVEDDGVGFDLKSIERGYEQRGSMGMLNLHERAELVNGRLEIDSTRGRGTTITLIVPQTAEAANRLNSFVPAA